MDNACLGAVGKLHCELLKINVAAIDVESSSADSDRPREFKQEDAALLAASASSKFNTQAEKEYALVGDYSFGSINRERREESRARVDSEAV